MSDLAARLRAAIDALGEGETYAERNLSNLAGEAADALDKAEAERDTARHDFEAAELARAGAEVIAAAARAYVAHLHATLSIDNAQYRVLWANLVAVTEASK